MSHRRSRRVQLVVFLGCLGTLFSLGSGVANVKASEIRWLDDLQVARRLSATTNRPLLLHFWAPWCSPCKQMEQTTFVDPNVMRLLDDHYIPVKLNIDHPTSKEVAAQHGVQGVPTDIVVAPDGRILAKSSQALSTQDYTAMLTQTIAMMHTPRVAQTPQVQAPPTVDPLSNAPMQREGYAPGSTVPDNRGPAPYNYNTSSTPPQQQGQQPYDDPNRFAAAEPPQNVMPQQGPYGAMLPSNPPFAAQPELQNSPQQQPAQPQAMAGAPQQYPTQPAYPQQQPQQFQSPQPQQFQPQQQPPLAQQPVEPDQNPPSYGLEGYCPVELLGSEKWVPGDLRYGAVHEGVTYLFAGPEQQSRFLADPMQYAPANRGFDIVLSTETGQDIPGKRQHGVFLVNGNQGQRQIYLFSSEATLKKFQAQIEISDRQAAARQNVPQQPQQNVTPSAQPEQAVKPWWYR